MRVFFIFLICLLCNRGLAQSTQCKENEEYQECASGCPLTCENYRKPIFCTVNCKSGCFCRPGYVKGPDDKCIRPSQCPIGPCKDGEVASTCINPCNNCIEKGKCYFEFCVKGCDCKQGYYRNSTDVCVPAEKCGSETHYCQPNEHWVSCVSLCNDCWSKGHCPQDSYCQPGCECNPGYYRDDYGTCISESECEHHDNGCGPNEIFTDCVNSCNDCEHKGHCDHYDCHYGCDCQRGYFRNHDGHCIPESECSATVCGHYEQYSECGSACPISCDNYNKQIPCTLRCVKGCFCSRGYIRGPRGNCIKPNECPRVCGEYEEYSECGTACPLHCCNATTPLSTPCPNICVRGCFCRPGYVRGPHGKCILKNECPPICGEYEEYKECGPGCVATCGNRAQIGDCSLPCKKGCFCTAGYIRGPDGKCILPESCPPVCGRNEEYQDCGSACPANCTNQTPSCREYCVRGCFCKPGYIRDPYGICVLPTNCPLLCEENEIFMSCGPLCEPSCDAIHRNPALCPGCQRGCFCKPGYVRGPNGKCILPLSCPIACGENEEYQACGSACPANCTNRSPTCINTCVRGCFCKRGFIRNTNSNYSCILPEACPVVCGEYEEFKQCGTLCPPSCDNRNPTCEAQCVRGCFCQPGYIKDVDGKCILPSQCPEKCQEYETYRLCGTSCPITCSNIGKSVSCKLHCNRGCFCNDGYVRGPNGTCITPDLCPLRCKRNEVYTCSTRSCEISCDDDEDSIPSCIGDCTNGCYCRRGFVRSPDGDCVPRSQCPRVIGFNGRNKGEDTTLSISSTLTKSSSVKPPLELSTKLGEPLPVLLDEAAVSTPSHFKLTSSDTAVTPPPIISSLADKAVSTPANIRLTSLKTILSSVPIVSMLLDEAVSTPGTLQTTLSSNSISEEKEIPKTAATSTALLQSPENSKVALTTNSPSKSSENTLVGVTTESLVLPTMALDEVSTSIQTSVASKPAEIVTSTTELENSTLNGDSKTSLSPKSTPSTNGSTTVL